MTQPETPAQACPEPAEAPAGAGAEPPGAPAGAPRELRNRYTAADLAVFTSDEASRFIPQGDGDPRGDMVLAWELLYRLEPELYDRLAGVERLHPGVVGWLPRDVGRIAEFGSVVVSDFMTIERFSHVMHIVSHVSGQLAGGRTAYDVMRATFPAGTVSGAPQLLDTQGLSDPYFRAASESAIRAVKMCAPYKLPTEKYDAWNEVTVTFDPTKMAGF